MDESQEIIDRLLKVVETLSLRTMALTAFITVHHGAGWEASVARVQDELAPHIGELFAPLEDAIAGAPDGSYPANVWRQVVRGLVDSVAPQAGRP
jgi:hypothetical protein